MGWWHYGVMDGDTVCDIEIEIRTTLVGEICGSDRELVALRRRSIELLQTEAGIAKVLASKDEICGRLGLTLIGNEYLFWQVLGFLCLQHGASIDTFKGRLIHSIEADRWAQFEPKRMKFMDRFLAQVSAYDGQPISELAICNLCTERANLDVGPPASA